MVPVAGSAYTYAYVTLGELFAWIIGWDLILEYAVGSATVAHGWSHYFQDFIGIFGLHLPKALTIAPFDFDTAVGHFVRTGSVFDLPAIVITAIVTLVLVKGIRESAVVQRRHGGHQDGHRAVRHRGRARSSSTPPTGTRSPRSATAASASSATPSGARPAPTARPLGMLAGAAIIFFAYIGFDSVSTHAEEARNPQRDVPIGIITSLLICTVLYIAVSVVLTGMVP